MQLSVPVVIRAWLKGVAFMALYREKRARLFSEVHSNRTRDDGHRWKFQLENSNYIYGDLFILTMREVKF